MNKDISEILVTSEELGEHTRRLGEQITRDFAGKKLFIVGVLNGCIYFLTDLSRHIDLPCRIDFMQASSYGGGTCSCGDITIVKNISGSLQGYDVLLVDDILDTGYTLSCIRDMLLKKGADSVSVAVLLDKPAGRKADIKADYVGVDVPNEFVVGYGFDYNQRYRNLPYIGVLRREVYESAQ